MLSGLSVCSVFSTTVAPATLLLYDTPPVYTLWLLLDFWLFNGQKLAPLPNNRPKKTPATQAKLSPTNTTMYIHTQLHSKGIFYITRDFCSFAKWWASEPHEFPCFDKWLLANKIKVKIVVFTFLCINTVTTVKENRHSHTKGTRRLTRQQV